MFCEESLRFHKVRWGRRSKPVLTPRQPPLHVALSPSSERWRHSHLSSPVESGVAGTLGARSGVKTVVETMRAESVLLGGGEARGPVMRLELIFCSTHARSADCCSNREPWYITSQSAPARSLDTPRARVVGCTLVAPVQLRLDPCSLARLWSAGSASESPNAKKWHLALASHRAATVHSCAALSACA